MFVLSEIFKESPQVKIVEAFVENSDKMLYLTEIERMIGITKMTISDHINKLLEEGIIERKGQEGRKQFYQLNKNNPKSKILLRIEQLITDEKLGDSIKKDTTQSLKYSSQIYDNKVADSVAYSTSTVQTKTYLTYKANPIIEDENVVRRADK